MKMTVEFNSIADLANFSKFIDQRLAEEDKANQITSLNQQIATARKQLERAYARLRFRDDISKVENIPLDQVPIKVRTYNCLDGAGCKTVGDVLRLFDKNQLREITNFGDGSFNNLKQVFAQEYKIDLDRSIK